MKWPVSCLAGIAVIVLYCIFTFVSWALYPTSYSPATNWLSDLGNSTFNPRGAVFYNVGCILTGIALFPFFGGLYKWYTDEGWRKSSLIITQIVGVFSAFALIMIGVFSEDILALHVLWTRVYFLLLFVVLVLSSISLFTHPKFIKPIAYYAFALIIVDLLFILVTYVFRRAIPLLEWFTSFTSLGLVGLITYNMLKAGFTS